MALHSTKRTYSRLPKEQREKDILKAAREEFCRNGYDGAMISAIAAKAGVVEGTIYKYFHNKRALLIRVVEKWYEGMVKDNTALIEGIIGTRNRLHQVIFQHLSSIHAEPQLCRLVFSEIRNAEEYRGTNVAEWNRRYTQVAMDIVVAGMNTGECRSDISLRFVRDMIYGTMEHCTWSFLHGGDDFDPRTVALELTELVYRSIAKVPDVMTKQEIEEIEINRLSDVTRRLELLADQFGKLTEK